MISTLYFGAILLGLVINNGRGQPSITSTVLPLSGELCPDTVTFICNWLDTVIPVIDFYINDTRLVRYQHDSAHTFPSNVTPVPTGFMAQISSAELNAANNEFNYLNFTLSVHLDDLKSYQGQDIFCGTISVRSNVIPIDNYSTRDVPPFSSELLNITLTAVYVGLELTLNEINVVWDDLTFFDNCYQNIRYIAKLTNQDMMQNGDCNNMTCSAKFLLGNEGIRSDIYLITVTAFSDAQRISSGPISLNTSVTNGFTIRNITDCKQRIICSSNNNDNCSVQYQESESSSVKSFEVYKERALNFMSGNLVYLEITKKISPNLTFIANINYTADNPRRNYNDLVGVGVTLMILGFIIEIVGSVVVVYWVIHCIIKSSVVLEVFMWIHCMSWLLVILSLSLWISYGVVNDPGSCTSGPEEPIAIVATVISILLAVVSVVITGALVLKCTWRIRKSSVVKKVSYDERYKLLFGKKNETKEYEANTHNCKCGATLGDIKIEDVTDIKSAVFDSITQLKDDFKSFKTEIVEKIKPHKNLPSTKPEVTEGKKRKCRACPNNMCRDCSRYAFRKQTLEWQQVCNDCYIGYEKEKERILELPKVGLFEPVEQEYDGICYECESAEKKQELEYCPGCGHWVCGTCIETNKPVYLQYSNEHDEVCRNCYALIKIMDGNPYSKDKDVKEVNDDVAQETQPEIMQGSLKATHKEGMEEVTDKFPCEPQVKVVPGNFESEHTEDRKKDKQSGKEKLPTQMKALQCNNKSNSKEDEAEGKNDEILNTKL